MNEVSNWRFPCYTEDEGRSLGVALQEEASNHLKGLSLRAVVLSVQEKSGNGQVSIGKVMYKNHI